MTHGPYSEKKLKKIIRPFYKFWPLWLVLVVVCAWPQFNDWQWDLAKDEARGLIARYEIEQDAQAMGQVKVQEGPGQPAHSVMVPMPKLTCMAANSFFAPYWQMNASYRVKLIQAFIWHGYDVEIPSAKAIGERGCGQTDDGKYVFSGH